MNWEDTVLDAKSQRRLWDEMEYYGIAAGLNEVAEAQAEASFKAGIREVVEWLKDNNAWPDHILDEWKAFLKEKGIEEVNSG